MTLPNVYIYIDVALFLGADITLRPPSPPSSYSSSSSVISSVTSSLIRGHSTPHPITMRLADLITMVMLATTSLSGVLSVPTHELAPLGEPYNVPSLQEMIMYASVRLPRHRIPRRLPEGVTSSHQIPISERKPKTRPERQSGRHESDTRLRAEAHSPHVRQPAGRE